MNPKLLTETHTITKKLEGIKEFKNMEKHFLQLIENDTIEKNIMVPLAQLFEKDDSSQFRLDSNGRDDTRIISY